MKHRKEYEQVRPLLIQLTHRAVKTYHFEWEEAESEIHLAFCLAMRRYDPKRVKLTTYVHLRAWNHILHVVRVRANRSRRASENGVAFDPNEFDVNLVPDQRPSPHRLKEALEVFGGDALMVAYLALHPPKEVAQVLQGCRSDWRTYRRALWCHLLNCGWDQQRVKESFRSVSEALSTLGA